MQSLIVIDQDELDANFVDSRISTQIRAEIVGK
jgi:hypothetical protein